MPDPFAQATTDPAVQPARPADELAPPVTDAQHAADAAAVQAEAAIGAEETMTGRCRCGVALDVANTTCRWHEARAGRDTTDLEAAQDDSTIAEEPQLPFGPLPLELTLGLTVWGIGWGAQMRLEAVGEIVDGHVPAVGVLYLHLDDRIARSSEDGHPARLDLNSARALRDLLNVATARGFL